MNNAQENEFEALKAVVEKDYGIKVKTSNISQIGFMGAAEIVILSFVLGTIAKSFFSEIGKDLWEQMKSLGQLFFDGKASDTDAKVDVHITYKGVEIEIVTKLRGKKSGKYNVELLAYFWDTLPTQCLYLINQIDGQSEYYSRYKKAILQLSDQDREWDLKKVKK